MNQITTNFGTLSGTSVASILGIDAEKNRIDDTDSTATIYFVINDASTTNNDGRNISVIEMALAFATNNGSGICNTYVSG